jgi:hypothetical protein
MKTGTASVATLFAVASFSLLAQQPTPATQPNAPPTQQQPATTEQAPPNNPAAAPQTPAPETPAVELSPVTGELVSKLDSKTAKAGDNVVIQTKSSAKTADGTEIPKGSKLVGHVLVAQPSGAGANSQVALQIDHIELKGGQSVPVHSQIQSIAPPEGAAAAGGSPATSGAPAGGPPNPSTGAANGGSRANGAPQQSSDPGAAGSPPAAGTVVARSGKIAITTTSIPGVLLANNEPGQQDPRMAQASSILLGAKKDIQLDGGTQVVVGVSSAGAAAAK